MQIDTKRDTRIKELLSRIRNASMETDGEFDPVFYRLFYDDMQNAPDDNVLREHFEKAGKAELRYGSAVQLLKACDAKPSDLPTDFDPAEYLNKNFDLGLVKKTTDIDAIENFLRYAKMESRLYRAPYSNKSLYQLNPNTLQSNKKLGVLVHIFYPEIWDELFSYIKNIQDIEFDVHINIVNSIWSNDLQDKIQSDLPKAKIIVSENKGRDIGGFLFLMRQINFDNYDIFCFLHSKKSVHVPSAFAQMWRRNLCNALLKNPDKCKENVMLFRSNPQIGMIASGRHYSLGVMNNQGGYNRLLDKLEISGAARECTFVAGTMMMIRPIILKPLLTVLNPEKMEECDTLGHMEQIDGLEAHAVERVIGNLVQHLEYEFFWQREE